MAVIVYTEDDPINARVFETMVRHLGDHQVSLADSIAATKQLLEGETPQFLFMDLNLSDGFVLDRFSEISSCIGIDTVCVAVSAERKRDMESRALSVGFHAYMEKPLDMDALKALIDSRTG